MTTIQRVLEIQRGQIGRLTLSERRRLHKLLVASRNEIRDSLDAVRADSFTAQNYKVALLRVKAGIAQLERSLAAGFETSAQRAFELANRHLIQQIKAASRQFEGTIRATTWQPALAVDNAVLLDRFEASVATYGRGLIQKVQRELALASVQGISWSEMTRRVAGLNGILAQDYQSIASKASHRQSRAEAIVRTEMSSAYNAGHHENLIRANEADPGYQKTLVATFDNRTGDDSRFVHGQVREIGEPFEDNAGRIYMHPPNRPNDREIEIPTRPEWRAAGFGAS